MNSYTVTVTVKKLTKMKCHIQFKKCLYLIIFFIGGFEVVIQYTGV